MDYMITVTGSHDHNRHEFNNAGTLPWKVFVASQGRWKWSDNSVSTKQRETWRMPWVSDQILIHQFLYETWLYRGNAIFELL